MTWQLDIQKGAAHFRMRYGRAVFVTPAGSRAGTRLACQCEQTERNVHACKFHLFKLWGCQWAVCLCGKVGWCKSGERLCRPYAVWGSKIEERFTPSSINASERCNRNWIFEFLVQFATFILGSYCLALADCVFGIHTYMWIRQGRISKSNASNMEYGTEGKKLGKLVFPGTFKQNLHSTFELSERKGQ